MLWPRIKPGETVYSLMRKHGFAERSVTAVMRENLFPASLTLVPDALYKVTTNKELQLKQLTFFDPDSDSSFVVWQDGGSAGSRVQTETFVTKIKNVTGRVRGSLLESLLRAAPDIRIAYRFMDAYVLDFDLRKAVQREAFFRVKYEEKYQANRLVKTGEVLETELEVGPSRHPRKFVYYEGGGSHVGPMGMTNARTLYSPVNYQHYSSLFIPRRFHPIKKRRQAHLGLDFEVPAGHPVFTVAPGQVMRVGKNRAAGNFVVVRHAGGLESYYNHLQAIDSSIAPGRTLENGQKLGTVGCTGYCTKAHLHFALKQVGRFVNPAKFLKPYAFHGRTAVKNSVQQFAEAEVAPNSAGM